MNDITKRKGGLTGPPKDEVLRELCERKATLLLATPHLSFESRFLERDGERLRVRASMGRELAMNTLSRQPLRIRFPWDLSMYCGSVRILDYEQEEHRRTLVISVPESLGEDEQRSAYRADRVGRSRGSLGSTGKGDPIIQPFNLENLSTLGAGVFLNGYRGLETWQPGMTVQASFELEGGTRFDRAARICHSSGPYLGLEFRPPLKEPDLGLVHRWVTARRNEAQRMWDNRDELRAQAAEAAKPKAAPSGMLLLSSDASLGAQIEHALESMHELRVVPAVMAPLRAAMAQPPLIVLLDTAGMGSEERRRARALLEAQPPGCPVLVLGRDPENDQGRLLATELRQASYLEWAPGKGTTLKILVQGLIRRHWKPE